MTTEERQFDVALSFAGEDRAYVEKVASKLREMGIKVFYDKYELVTLWGKNLYDHLQDVYQNKAKYTVMFISKHYADKVWTNHERKSAQARAFVSNQEYILPVKLDETIIPGILKTFGYINVVDYVPEDLAKLIKQKVGPIQRYEFLPEDLDVLFKEMKARSKNEKGKIYDITNLLFKSIKLMTIEERDVLFDTVINSCRFCLPKEVHINLDVLSRVTNKSEDQIKALYSRLDCLGFETKLRKIKASKNRVCKDGYQIDIKYLIFNKDTKEELNAMDILAAIIQIIHENYCPKCSKEVFKNIDFSILNSLTGFPEETK
jgi:hypothetical protein